MELLLSPHWAAVIVGSCFFIPLKTADQVLGVLALHIQHPVPWFTTIERMQQEQVSSNSRIDFFWTFLEQATSILERARLRSSVASRNE